MLLEHGCGLATVAQRRAYSLHSFRISLACALYAAGCPNDRIMAILRWRSEESLAIYARMNDGERTGWVLSSMTQQIDSTVTAHLPRIDADDYIAHLQAAVVSGELGQAAADADAGTMEDDEPAGSGGGDRRTAAVVTRAAGAAAIAAVAAAVQEELELEPTAEAVRICGWNSHTYRGLGRTGGV